MQRHTVHRRRHTMFADAPIDIAPAAVIDVENAQIAGLGVVRSGQIRRPANGFAEHGVDDLKHHFRRFAGRHFGRLFGNLLFQGFDNRRQFFRRVACIGAVELGLFALGDRGETPLPFFAIRRAARADRFPLRFDVRRHFEGACGPSIGGFGIGDQLGVGQGAVAFGGVLGRRAKGDVGLACNHRRFAGLFRGGDGGVDLGGVMPVDLLHMPPRGLEPLHLIGAVRQFDRAVDGDVVVVPKHDQLGQLVAPRKAQGLLAHALHQAPVARDHISMVIDDLLAVMGALDFFGHGKAHSGGNPLAQRACGDFDTVEQEVFGVARGFCAHLAEVLDLVQCDLLVARQIEQRIDQHRAVTCREDKPVTIRPERIFRIELEVVFKQNRGHIGHAHRHAGVAGIGGGNRIEGERADRSGFHPVVGVRRAQGSNVQEAGPLIGVSVNNGS